MFYCPTWEMNDQLFVRKNQFSQCDHTNLKNVTFRQQSLDKINRQIPILFQSMACHYTIKRSEYEQNKMIIFLQRIVTKLFCDPSYE